MTPNQLAAKFEHAGEVDAEHSAKGWHFCWDWDFLVVGPGTPEWDGCNCGVKERVDGAFSPSRSCLSDPAPSIPPQPSP